MKTVKQDREGNLIGNGRFHVDYTVFDFNDYPQISSNVTLSNTSESVYVTYKNNDNGKKITLRFSTHVNNAVAFGDQLNGYTAGKNEVLYHLGLKNRTFIPETYLFIENRRVSKKDVAAGIYQIAELTIQELYALGKDADISQYKGKVAKNSNYLILGERVKEAEKKINVMGFERTAGRFVYND